MKCMKVNSSITFSGALFVVKVGLQMGRQLVNLACSCLLVEWFGWVWIEMVSWKKFHSVLLWSQRSHKIREKNIYRKNQNLIFENRNSYFSILIFLTIVNGIGLKFSLTNLKIFYQKLFKIININLKNQLNHQSI